MISRISYLAVLTALSLTPIATADDKPDYTGLSQLIQQAVVASMGKEWEDLSDWNKTIPIPPGKLPLAGLRTRVKVGDHEELPHGSWTRTKLWLDDPAKDIRIDVRDLRKLEANKYRLQFDGTIALHGERERKQWQKGIHLLGISAQADAVVLVRLECDVNASLNVAKVPPELQVEPKVVETKLELKEFELRRVGSVVQGNDARELGNEYKGVAQELLRTQESKVKDLANRAIAKALQDGKGTLSAATLFKLNASLKPKE